jgi:hypothetical protein
MIMKNASDDIKVLVAEVELAHARFSNGEDIGIEFKNEIDAWTKMEVNFRQQIKLLRTYGIPYLNASQPKKNKSDLKSLVYSVRERLD